MQYMVKKTKYHIISVKFLKSVQPIIIMLYIRNTKIIPHLIITV